MEGSMSICEHVLGDLVTFNYPFRATGESKWNGITYGDPGVVIEICEEEVAGKKLIRVLIGGKITHPFHPSWWHPT